MKKLHKLYNTFLTHPYINALLVFEDYHFQGIFLKKDLEQKLKDTNNNISPYIIKVSNDTIEELIFNEPPNSKMHIPFIDSQGELLGKLLYEEFVSEFFTEDFKIKLSLKEIFYYLNHPVIILNRFHTILYLNHSAKELLSENIFGHKISEVLLGFNIGIDTNDNMTISRQEETWYVNISRSSTPHANYSIYQFIPKSFSSE